MTHRPSIAQRRRARARKRREGIVLLVVLTVLMLITSTAIFAVQQTMWEMRAGGSANQAMATRYAAEGYATLGVTALGSDSTRDTLLASYASGDGWRTKYSVPLTDISGDHGSASFAGYFNCTRGFFCDTRTDNFPVADIGPFEGSDGTLIEDSMVHVESWLMSDASSPVQKYRHIVTSYGSLFPVGDTDPDPLSDADRRLTETISISRAYYTIESP
jgi:hypothetical protein